MPVESLCGSFLCEVHPEVQWDGDVVRLQQLIR